MEPKRVELAEANRNCVVENRHKTHIVFQALDDLDAVVAQIKLFQAHEVLQTLDLCDPVTLRTGAKDISSATSQHICIIRCGYHDSVNT